jgi:hypothetical protein
VLALAGAAGGLLIAAAVPAVTALPALSHVPRLADAGVDWRVLVFALCVSIVAALIFTLVPAAAFSGRSGIPAQEALRAGSRVGRTVRAGRLLAAGEIALATLVLVVALVLTSAFARLLDRDPGIRSDGLMTLRVALPPTYSRSGEITRFFDAAVDRIKALPGVESAGAITQLPFSGAMLGSSFRVDPADGGGVRQADADLRGVTPDYFATLGIGLVEGRLLSARDAAPAPMVAVIDETLARRARSAGGSAGSGSPRCPSRSWGWSGPSAIAASSSRPAKPCTARTRSMRGPRCISPYAPRPILPRWPAPSPQPCRASIPISRCRT